MKPPTYTAGLRDEARIIAFLNRLGWVCTPSTREDNIMRDIDCWNGKGESVSIKAQRTGARTGNFCFELQQYFPDTDAWMDSWFRTGAASIYVILADDAHVYAMRSKVLKTYVALHGFDSIRSNMRETVASQTGLRQSDARNGLIKISTLTKSGMVRLKGTL